MGALEPKREADRTFVFCLMIDRDNFSSCERFWAGLQDKGITFSKGRESMNDLPLITKLCWLLWLCSICIDDALDACALLLSTTGSHLNSPIEMMHPNITPREMYPSFLAKDGTVRANRSSFIWVADGERGERSLFDGAPFSMLMLSKEALGIA